MPTFKADPFYSRTAELAALDRAWTRHGSGGQMMLLYGRRRLGKTYLLQRYFTGGVTGNETLRPHSYYLAEQTTAAAQRTLLARQLISDLPFGGATEEEIAVLSDYMGSFVFEEICSQWLRRHAHERLGLTVRQMARYWSRDGRTEIDIMGELDDEAFLFGECKWRSDSVAGASRRPKRTAYPCLRQ